MPDQNDLVDDLVCQCLQARAVGDSAAATALLAAQAPAVRAEVEALLATLDRVGLGGDAAAAPTDRTALPFGPYLLLERLGAGAMGVVYRARRPNGALCALKLLHPGLLPVRRARLRFDREIQALRELDHPDLCPILDAGEVDGVPFLVMPLLAGESMQVRFARGLASTAAERNRLLGIIERVAMALHHAHERGFVHRDVKPANVLVGPDDGPVVLDFGLARLDRDDAATLSQSREVIGAPAYMAPEQIADGRTVDRRADVYALGVLLYEGLTGRCPYEAATRESLYRRILTGDARAPSRHVRDLPAAVDIVCLTALAREPDRRYRTAADFAADLERVRTGQRPLAQLSGWGERTRRWVRRNPLPSTLGCLLLIAVAVASLQTVQERRTAARDRARVLAATALDVLPADPDRALALAHESHELAPDVIDSLAALEAARAADREDLVLRGHTMPITDLQYDSSGEHLVSASLDGTARVWRTRDGAAIVLRHGTGGVEKVAPQPHGELVATGGRDDGIVRAWRMRDGSQVWEQPAVAAGHAVKVLLWSPDGHQLLAAGACGATVFDTSGTGRQVCSSPSAVTAAAWLDGDEVVLGSGQLAGAASGAGPHWIRRFRIAATTIEPFPSLAVPVGVRSIHLRPPAARTAGTPVAIVVDAADAAYWWLPDAAQLEPLPVAQSRRVLDATWTAAGHEALTLTPAGWLARWRADRSFAGAVDTISWPAGLVPHPTDDIVAIAGGFGVVQLRPPDASTGLLLGRRRLSPLPPAFAPDGRHLATSDREHTVRVWPLWRSDHPRFLCGDLVRTAVWCTDGRRILTGSHRAADGSGCVRAWDATTGALLATQNLDAAVAKLVAADRGAWLATYGRAQRGSVAEVANIDGSLGHSPRPVAASGLRFPIDAASLPDGRLAVVEEDGDLVLLDTASGAILQRLPTEPPSAGATRSHLLAVTAAADGAAVWAGGTTGVLHRFDRSTDGRYAPAPGRPLGEAIRQIEWVDDGSLLVAQGNGVLQRLMPDGTTKQFAGHRDDVCDVHWTRARGELLVASGDYAGSVRLWRGDGTPIREIRAHIGPVWSIRFSPDGDRLLTGSNDGTARIWQVQLHERW